MSSMLHVLELTSRAGLMLHCLCHPWEVSWCSAVSSQFFLWVKETVWFGHVGQRSGVDQSLSSVGSQVSHLVVHGRDG